MTTKRNVDIYSAGCPICQDTIDLVNQIACPSCNVNILDMNVPDVAKQAEQVGVRSAPAVVIDGKLASCCEGRTANEADLRAAGIGQPLD